jgi:hypothetical protein
MAQKHEEKTVSDSYIHTETPQNAEVPEGHVPASEGAGNRILFLLVAMFVMMFIFGLGALYLVVNFGRQ